MQENMEKWEKHAKETIEKLKKSEPTTENARMMADAIIILCYDKFEEMEYKLMGKDDRYQNRGYGRYDRGYENRYDRY